MVTEGRFRVGYHPALGLLLGLLAGIGLDYLRPLPSTPWPLGLRLAFGLPPLLLSLALAGWGLVAVRAARTPFEPGHTPRALVVAGPFRFSRNPLYLAQILLLAGLGQAAFPWLLPIAVLQALLLDRLAIPREEQALAETFGEDFAAYRARVRRWI